jgi:hypothetical protein
MRREEWGQPLTFDEIVIVQEPLITVNRVSDTLSAKVLTQKTKSPSLLRIGFDFNQSFGYPTRVVLLYQKNNMLTAFTIY